MENQTAENLVETAPVTNKKSFLQRTPKWALISVPVLAVALVGYGLKTGTLQEVGTRVSAAITNVAPTMTQASVTQDKLTVAREAFAAGDMNKAIESYRAFVAGNPTDIAARGELGNVYYTVGAQAEAAQSFFEVATMSIEKNQLEVAESLMPAISEGNPQLAYQLGDKLFEAHLRASDIRAAELNRQFESEKQKFDLQMQQPMLQQNAQQAQPQQG
jgi:alkyl sulfatase BDS1-like metallo-beta-lactamase superfamily hydrolase